MTTREIHAWLINVIRQRELLIRKDRSRQNISLMVAHTTHLRKYLQAYSYRDPVRMARFIDRNLHRILSILPGPGSKCHESRIRELNEILQHLESTKLQTA